MKVYLTRLYETYNFACSNTKFNFLIQIIFLKSSFWGKKILILPSHFPSILRNIGHIHARDDVI